MFRRRDYQERVSKASAEAAESRRLLAEAQEKNEDLRAKLLHYWGVQLDDNTAAKQILTRKLEEMLCEFESPEDNHEAA